MQMLMRALAVAAVLGLVAPDSLSGQAFDLAGIYSCEGVGANGDSYKGVVEIEKNQDSYRVRWALQSTQVQVGLGIVSGDVLAVSYYGPGDTGIVVYRIEAGERLVGRWTAVGGGGVVYSETLKKMGPGREGPPGRRVPVGVGMESARPVPVAQSTENHEVR